MHYEVSYEHVSGEAKQAKALNDIKEYLGVRKFNNFEKLVKMQQMEKPVSFMEFALACYIGGISGYPVEAWATSLGIEVVYNEDF